MKKHLPRSVHYLLLFLLIFSAISFVGGEIFIQHSSAVQTADMTSKLDRSKQEIAKLQATLAAKHKAAAKLLAEQQAAEKKYRELIAPDTTKLPVGGGTFVRKINTNKPVVFLTMDDGEVKSPEAFEFIKTHRLNPTLFLADKYIQDNYDYFKQYLTIGSKIESHTLTHPHMPLLASDTQKTEICGSVNKLASTYGASPTLMRPPYGEYTLTTLQVAKTCGLTAVVNWSAKVNGGALQYQTGHHLVAGDIVLMHFRPEIMSDLTAFYDEITAQGLTPAYLTDWL